MYTANDMVHTGDKLEVTGSCFPKGKIHILAQVQANLFTLISVEDGNRICDPFPCKYGTRLRSGNQSAIDTELYGSFTLQDLSEAITSQSDLSAKYTFKIVERFCHPSVFDRLANAWNEKSEHL